MWFWKKKEEGLSTISNHLQNLSVVQEENKRLFDWIRFLHNRSEDQEKMVDLLRQQLASVDDNSDLSQHYIIQDIQTRLRELDLKISELSVKKMVPSISQVFQKTSLKEKVLRRLNRNSKTYIKNMLMSYVEKYGPVSALQLKDMLVDEQNICSKSSFYRLLTELEYERLVLSKRDGREKVYSVIGKKSFPDSFRN